MNKLFSLEVDFSNMHSIIVGDEVIVDPNITPRGNGKDIAVFVKNGEEKFISTFTRFGNQISLIGEDGQIQVVNLLKCMRSVRLLEEVLKSKKQLLKELENVSRLIIQINIQQQRYCGCIIRLRRLRYDFGILGKR